MIKGYVRVSTKDQNTDRQYERLLKAGVKKFYCEKQSGKNTFQREEFQRMIAELEKDDLIIVTDLTRISRNTVDFLNTVNLLKSKKVCLKTLDDAWFNQLAATGGDSPLYDLFLLIMAGLAEFERKITSQRVRDGLATARAKGNVGGRPRVDNAQITKALALYNAKDDKDNDYTIEEICKRCNISKTTLYNYVRAARAAKPK